MTADAFHRPASVEDACAAVAAHPEATVVAGGQSLLPLLRSGLLEAESFVDVGGLPGLRGIDAADGELRLGAGATWADIAASDTVRAVAPAVASLAGDIGDVQVRARGTIGGSLCHADPAADMPALLSCYDTRVECRRTGGERVVPLDDFVVGMFETALDPDELVTAVRVAPPAAGAAGAYEKFEYRRGGFSMVGVGATVALDGERVDALRVALANCGDRPVTVPAASTAAEGAPIDDTSLDAVAAAVRDAADPVGDAYGSRAYRIEVAGRLARRCVERAAGRAGA